LHILILSDMGKNVNFLNVINLTYDTRAFLCGEVHKNTFTYSS
jgi:hypothetical protein